MQAKVALPVPVLPVLEIAKQVKPVKIKPKKVWPVITDEHIWCTVQLPELSGKGYRKEGRVPVLRSEVANARSRYEGLGAKFCGPLQ